MGQERIIRKLTPRQIEVLNLLAGGKAYKEVAKDLGISPHTVKGILLGTKGRRIYKYVGAYERLGVHSKSQAVMEAIRLGYIDPDEVEMRLRHEEEAMT